MEEQWKPIPGYEEHYQVSNLGRVKSSGRRHHDCILRPGRTGKYLNVVLSKDGKTKSFMIHTLMGMVWMEPAPEEMSWVKHLDGNRHNNNIENLEWGDRAGIMRQSFIDGGHSRIQYEYGFRYACVRDNRLIAVFRTAKKATDFSGMTGYLLGQCIINNTPDDKGNYWYEIDLMREDWNE